MNLEQWLDTEQGEYWEEKAHQGADDGYYDDIIQSYFETFGEDITVPEPTKYKNPAEPDEDTRTYDEKYSNALTNLQCLRGTITFIRSDAKHLFKINDYKIGDFYKDLDSLEKNFEIHLDYLTEMTKEIQKTYKMH